MDGRSNPCLKSVRSLPKGRFDIYRKMFDANDNNSNKNGHSNKVDKINGKLSKSNGSIGCKTNNYNTNSLNDITEDFYSDEELEKMEKKDILQLPYTDDEKSSHLRNTKLNQNCNNNASKFGIYSKTSNIVLPNQRNIDDSKSVVSFNSKTKLTTVPDPDQANDTNNKSEAKSITSLNKTDKSDLDSETVKVKDKKEFFERQISNIVFTTTTTNLVTRKNLSKSCNFNKEIFQNRIINPNINAKGPKPEYLVIDDIELSDTSFEDESENDEDSSSDNQITEEINNIVNNNNLNDDKSKFSDELKIVIPPIPPPKPKRTFEHDIYTTFKLDLNKAFSTNIPEFDSFNMESPSKSVKSAPNDHIYESLGPFQNYIKNNFDQNDNIDKKNTFDDNRSPGKQSDFESPLLSRSSNQDFSAKNTDEHKNVFKKV